MSSAFAEQLRLSANTKHLAGKTLSHCVSLAQSIGQMADVGQRFTITAEIADRFIGSVQVGEYILTGEIPAASLVSEVITIKGRCCNHDSDCAVHNEPAFPAGECDCTLSQGEEQ